MDPITRRRISKRMRLAAASGGIHWLTMASIRRFAIWLTTVSRKNRQRRRRPPHRRVRWTLHHVSHSMASLILLLLTTTITIPLKGNHNSALIVFFIYFFFKIFYFRFMFDENPDRIILLVDWIRLCPLRPSAVVVFRDASAKKLFWKMAVVRPSVHGRGIGYSYPVPTCFFINLNTSEGKQKNKQPFYYCMQCFFLFLLTNFFLLT